MCEGFNLRFKREMQIHNNTLKVIRWTGWMVYVMNRNPKRRMLRPDELLKINDFEEKRQVELPTKEDFEREKKWLENKTKNKWKLEV